MNVLPFKAALSSDMTSLLVMVGSARSVGCGMNAKLSVAFTVFRSLSNLSGCSIISIRICFQDMKLS